MAGAKKRHSHWLSEGRGAPADARVVELFWGSLRRGVIQIATTANVPSMFYTRTSELPDHAYYRCVSLFEPRATPDMPEEEIKKHREIVYGAFVQTFKKLVKIFGGYPSSCPDLRVMLPLSILSVPHKRAILDELMPGSAGSWLMISDHWPNGRRIAGQTHYHWDLGIKKVKELTTYDTHTNAPPPAKAMALGSVLQQYLRGLQMANGVHFLGTPESALAFLHDNMPGIDHLSTVWLYYRFRLETKLSWGQVAPKTTPWAWRKLTNKLVHTCTGLQTVNVTIDSAFWDKVNWKKNDTDYWKTVEELINLPKQSSVQTGIQNPLGDNHPCGFLEKIGRLSAKNIKLKVTIDEANTHERELFLACVQARLCMCMNTRPPLAKKELCTCKTKNLHSSCVWNTETNGESD
ncbi:MAG: hypothetical protein M1820_010827 [Bogoriella megaspora]|nr:MAG: hypothetical protein M1820_010827 [Bogoriella megaspora]